MLHMHVSRVERARTYDDGDAVSLYVRSRRRISIVIIRRKSNDTKNYQFFIAEISS
jgi:hypothetical protein